MKTEMEIKIELKKLTEQLEKIGENNLAAKKVVSQRAKALLWVLNKSKEKTLIMEEDIVKLLGCFF